MPIDTSDPSLKQLLSETSTYTIIGQKAENAYFAAYHSTDNPSIKERAMTVVLKSNLRLVLKLAVDYHNMTGLSVMDFYAEGKLGLLEAFYKFDYTAGVKFASFAIWEINRHMEMVVNESDTIRVPIRQRKRVLKAMKKGISPSTLNYGAEAAAAINGYMSIDQPVEGDNIKDGSNKDVLLSDIIPDEHEDSNPEKAYEKELIKRNLNEAIETTLSPDESKLLRNLYGLDREESSLSEVAEDTGTSKEWVRRARNKALAKLKSSAFITAIQKEME